MINIIKVLYDKDYLIEKDLRFAGKVIKLRNGKNYQKEYKYKFQILQFKNNEWKQLVRIDNSTHFGRPQQHIHIKNKIEKTNIKLENIMEYIINLAKKLMKEDQDDNKSN